MRRAAGLAIAALLGAAAGGSLMLSLAPAGPTGREPPPPPGVTGPDRNPPPWVPPLTARPKPGVGRPRIPTVLAWTPTSLPSGYPAAVRALPQVRAAALVRSGTAWLTAWRDRSGAIERPPPGYMIPVEVAALDPSGYQRFVPPPDRQAIAGLAGGGALLGSTAAEIRGVAAGGTLRFGGAPIGVQGVIDDSLVGAHEVIVSSATGARMGIDRPRYLLVLPRRGVPPRRLEEALHGVLPAGVPLQVRGPGETPVFRHGDAVLPPVYLKDLFGEFAAVPAPGGMLEVAPRWVSENIRAARIPVLGRVHCHRRVIPLLRGAFSELARRGLGDLIHTYAGCYSPRFINRVPTAGLSHHAWGIAIDVNVGENRFGSEPNIDPRAVAVLQEWGFGWGGRWLVPDGMHFEFRKFPAIT